MLSWLTNLILTSKLVQCCSLFILAGVAWLSLHYDFSRRLEALSGSMKSNIARPIIAEEIENPIDYRPLSPYNFSFLINNEDLCTSRQHVSLLVFAYTAPKDFEGRELIRRTWGSPKLLARLGAVMVFPLGYSRSDILSDQINRESELYGDIVQANFMDSYKNLSYKGILMFKWARTYCRRAKFLLKVDIDVFVNIKAVVPFLMSKYAEETRFMGCKVHWRSSVMRPGAWCGKWCVPDSEYRGKFYPPYCWGSFYVISGDLLTALEAAIPKVPVWWIADVYLTGIIPRMVGNIKHIVLQEYLEEDTDYLMTRLATHPASVLFGFIHGMSDVRRAWHIAHRGAHTQSPPTWT